MRFAIFALLFSACGYVAVVEPIKPFAASWEEHCIQSELRCLNTSSSGGVAIPILAPLVVLHKAVSGEEVVRNCKLQGDLCRIRNRIFVKTDANRSDTSAPFPATPFPASQPATPDGGTSNRLQWQQ